MPCPDHPLSCNLVKLCHTNCCKFHRCDVKCITLEEASWLVVHKNTKILCTLLHRLQTLYSSAFYCSLHNRLHMDDRGFVVKCGWQKSVKNRKKLKTTIRTPYIHKVIIVTFLMVFVLILSWLLTIWVWKLLWIWQHWGRWHMRRVTPLRSERLHLYQ